MSVESHYRALLAAHAPLVSIVGANIALNSIPEGAVPPLLVFVTSQLPTHGMDGTVLDIQVNHATQCWGVDSLQAQAIATAVRGALAADADYLVLTEDTVFDEDRGLDGVELTVERWV